MYSIHNEEKSVIAERFIRTLKNKIYKHMTSVSKNMYINKLDDIGMNIIIHIIEQLRRNLLILKIIHILILKIKINDRDSKFKIGDHVRISKYKNIFTKGYMPNWSEEVFVVRNTVPQTHVINDLNGEEIIGKFYEKELQKTNQEEFRIEKVIKRKGDKLYVKWKGYDNSFNRWIDKKDLV